MRPGTDDQLRALARLGRRGLPAHSSESARRADGPVVVVVPARNQVDRRAHARKVALDIRKAPPIAVIGMLDPVVVIRCPAPQQRGRDQRALQVGVAAHRQPRRVGGLEIPRPRVVLRAAPQIGDDQRHEPVEPGEIERAALEEEVMARRRGHARHGGLVVRRSFGEREPLIEARVRLTVAADATVAARMGGRPFDHVVAVALLVAVGLERPVGRVAAANVDEKDEIAAPRGLDRKLRLGRVRFLAVRGSVDDRGKASGRIGANQRGA